MLTLFKLLSMTVLTPLLGISLSTDVLGADHDAPQQTRKRSDKKKPDVNAAKNARNKVIHDENESKKKAIDEARERAETETGALVFFLGEGEESVEYYENVIKEHHETKALETASREKAAHEKAATEQKHKDDFGSIEKAVALHPDKAWSHVRENSEVYGKIASLTQEQLKKLAASKPGDISLHQTIVVDDKNREGIIMFSLSLHGYHGPYVYSLSNKKDAIPLIAFEKDWGHLTNASLKAKIGEFHENGRISISAPIFTGLVDAPAALCIKPKLQKKNKTKKKGNQSKSEG